MNRIVFTVVVFLCVSRSHRISQRIVGGSTTTIERDGGYIVALRLYDMFLCGGSYVADKIVVTAAHCVWDIMGYIDSLAVQGGITSLKDKSPKVQVIGANIPEGYDHEISHLDVAVLKLKKSLTHSKVRLIRLCSRALQDGYMVKVSGWGHKRHNAGSQPEQILRSIKIPIMRKSKCKRIFKSVTDITYAMLCAGDLGRRDACQYDSGGPLVYKGELCGIVSFGVGCASDTFPGVYTDVYEVSGIIKKAIKKLNRI